MSLEAARCVAKSNVRNVKKTHLSDGQYSKTWKALGKGMFLTCQLPGEGGVGVPSCQLPQAHYAEQGPAVSTVPYTPSLSLSDWRSGAEYTEPGWNPGQALGTRNPERVHHLVCAGTSQACLDPSLCSLRPDGGFIFLPP